jgi:tetratricopeptide (TPR) repeat protein
VNQALRERQEVLVSSNLLSSPILDASRFRVEKAEQLLTIARQQRLRQELNNAKTNLVSLLTGEAPSEIKRSAILELALLAQDEGELVRAQQIFSQFLSKFPEDASVPEVLMRQGLLFRQMGAPNSALSKFFAVMSKAINIQADQMEYYQHLVLQAKTEIADTYYAQGRHTDAADYFNRLLRSDEPGLNRPAIRAKLIHCLVETEKFNDVVTQATALLTEAPHFKKAAEVRYAFAQALRRIGRHQEALQQVFILLQSQESSAGEDPQAWDYWRLRTGNDLANQLYTDGDYLGALQIYQKLITLNPTPAWQVPVWYQIGLSFERLQQPQKALEAFEQVEKLGQSAQRTLATQNLATVIEMAGWRRQHLTWTGKATTATRELTASPAQIPPGVPAPTPK